MMASKLSIAVFLLRVVRERVHKWILYAAVVVSVFAGTAFFFITMFQCAPVYYFWDRERDGRCIDPNVLSILAIVYSVFAIISDVTFVVLPCFLVRKLSMRRNAKIALIPLLSMGCMYV